MSSIYLAYLLFAFAGTLALQFIFKIKLPLKPAVFAIFVGGLLFVLWDVLAVTAGHWAFGWDTTLGIAFGNLPLEEWLFFVVIPFFGLTLWELFAESPTASFRGARRGF